jgi:hypothetical protein
MVSKCLFSDAAVAPNLDCLNSCQLKTNFMCMAELKGNDAQNGIENANNNTENETSRQMAQALALCLFGPPKTEKT